MSARNSPLKHTRMSQDEPLLAGEWMPSNGIGAAVWKELYIASFSVNWIHTWLRVSLFCMYMVACYTSCAFLILRIAPPWWVPAVYSVLIAFPHRR